MALKAGVDIIGNSAPLMAALGDASKATVDYEGTTVDAFANMDRSALAYAASLDRLALANAKYGAGRLGVAEATLRHQRVVQGLAASHTSAMSSIGRNLTTYATIPVVAGIAVAAKEATNFQSQMLLIQTQAGASAAEVKNMSAAVLQFAQSGAQQGPTELAQGLFHLESVGLRGAAAMSALKVASNAAAMGMAPLEDTASALAGAITSGIKGAGDYQKAMGTLNATIGAGNMHMTDLLGALSTGLLPKAKNAGLSLDEVGAALAVLTDRGMSAEQGATRLGQTFAFMEKQTPAATKALADMGISAGLMKETIGGPNGLYNVLEMLAQGMERVGAERGRTDILTAFGGGRSSGALLTLIQSLTSATSSYQGKLKEIASTSGKLATDEAAQQKTAAAQFHQDMAKMEADAVQFGNAILPLATTAVNTVAKIAGAFAGLPGPIKDELGVIAGALAIGGPLLIAVSSVTRAVQTIGAAFRTTAATTSVATATIDADMATVEASALAAKTEAAGLATELTGLSTMGAIAIPITLAIAGTPAVDALMKWAAGGINSSIPVQFGGSPGSGRGSGPSTDLPASKLAHWTAQQLAAVAMQHGPEDYAWYLEHPARSRQIVENVMKRNGGNLPPYSGVAGAGVAPSVQKALGVDKYGNPVRAPHDLPFGPLAVASGAMPSLTAAQQLQLALDRHPNNARLLAEKRRIDEHTLAWLTRRFHSGKITPSQFVTEAGPLDTEIASLTTKGTTATNKAKTAASKAQREHAAAITAQADQLKAAVGKVTEKGPTGGAHGLSKEQIDAYDTLIAFYKAEAHDAGLTATERARYAGLATEARKQQIAESLKGAANYEKISIEDAKAMVALSKRIKGDRAGQEKALREEIAAYASAAANPRVAATKRATYRADEATAREQLANLKGTYAPPMSLQLAFAKATATGNMGDLYKTALDEKKAAERAIKSGTLGMQGMIDAWNVIDTANQTLLTDISGASVKQSAAGFLRGLNLHGLTRLQKIAIEAGFSQSMAHAGHVPTGAGVQGVGTVAAGVVVHGDVHLHGVTDIDGIQKGLQRKGIYRAVQSRGPHAGHGPV